MKDLVPAEVEIFILLSRNFIRVCVVDIVELATFISVNFDIFRQKRIQTQHRVLAIPDDLCVGVAPEEQVRHKRFTENKRGHFGIRLIVKQAVQGVVDCFLLTACLPLLRGVHAALGANGSNVHVVAVRTVFVDVQR